MKPRLITCYVNPDLDGLAGAVAYAEFLTKKGKEAEAGVIGEPHDEAKYVLDRFHIPYPPSIPDASAYDEVVLVDASDLNGLDGKIPAEKVVEIIDHRKIHDAYKFPNAKIQIELVGAAVTLVAEKFIADRIDISKESAILLHTGIISNTLNFKGTVTTDRDRTAAAWLTKTSDLPLDFWKDLFTAKSDLSGTKLQEAIEGDFAWFQLGNKKVGIAQIEMMGAKRLVDTRTEDILSILKALKESLELDLIFQSTIELEEPRNIFITEDGGAQQLLEKVLDVRFTGNIAERSSVLMRKQIVPLLKDELEAAA